MFLLIYSSQNISIHAPREGSDVGKTMPRIDTLISIHAPREGSDGLLSAKNYETENFNPRSP